MSERIKERIKGFYDDVSHRKVQGYCANIGENARESTILYFGYIIEKNQSISLFEENFVD